MVSHTKRRRIDNSILDFWLVFAQKPDLPTFRMISQISFFCFFDAHLGVVMIVVEFLIFRMY